MKNTTFGPHRWLSHQFLLPGLVATAFVLSFVMVSRSFAQSPAATYFTGCLASGKISDLAVGTSPTTPCKSGEQQVSWSDGDILGVLPGSGLTGGGGAGEVTLSADTTYLQKRIIGSCPAGSSISSIDATGGVVCQSSSSYTAGDGLLLVGNQFGLADAGVTAAKIAAGAIQTNQIADAAVTTDKLGTNAVSTTESPPLPQAALQSPLNGFTDLPGMNFTKTTGDSNIAVIIHGFATVACPSSPLRFGLYRDGVILDQFLVSPSDGSHGGWGSYALMDAGPVTAGSHTWSIKAFFLNYGTAPTCEMVTYASAMYMNFKR